MTLLIGLAKASVIPKENPTICVALHCFLETGACWADSECYAILDCLQVKKSRWFQHSSEIVFLIPIHSPSKRLA